MKYLKQRTRKGFTIVDEYRLNAERLVSSIPKSFKMTCLMILVALDLMSFKLTWLMEIIHIGQIQDIYTTISGLLDFISGGETLTSPYCQGLLLILTVLNVWSFFVVNKEKLYLLRVSSFSSDMADVKISKSDTQVSYKNLDVCDEMKNRDVPRAVEKLDHCIVDVKKAKGGARFGVYGIMHTPLLFRLGYLIGDQDNIILYHKIRSNDSLFTEWRKETEHYRVDMKEENENIKSNILLLEISMSFLIKDSELTDLHPAVKHILKVKSKDDNYGFDVLKNITDADAIRDDIMKEMRRICKKYDIKKVEIVMSTSVAFTIYLGMAFSKQHDPRCVVYHYEKRHYPWGIDIDAAPHDCFIDND